MSNLAKIMRVQQDATLREGFNMSVEVLEYGIVGDSVHFVGAYINEPMCFITPSANYTFKMDENGNYIGLDIIPLGEYIVFGLLAICSGNVRPMQNMNNKGVPFQRIPYEFLL